MLSTQDGSGRARLAHGGLALSVFARVARLALVGGAWLVRILVLARAARRTAWRSGCTPRKVQNVECRAVIFTVIVLNNLIGLQMRVAILSYAVIYTSDSYSVKSAHAHTQWKAHSILSFQTHTDTQSHSLTKHSLPSTALVQ